MDYKSYKYFSPPYLIEAESEKEIKKIEIFIQRRNHILTQDSHNFSKKN
jgi:hypothetical protein